jgi:hypothetical protein
VSEASVLSLSGAKECAATRDERNVAERCEEYRSGERREHYVCSERSEHSSLRAAESLFFRERREQYIPERGEYSCHIDSVSNHFFAASTASVIQIGFSLKSIVFREHSASFMRIEKGFFPFIY